MAGSVNQSKAIQISGASRGPVPVGAFVASAAGKALQRNGAAIAGLMTNWPSIAGPSLAAYTLPVKLTKGAASPSESGTYSAAVLHLKVDPVKALEVQYAVPQLIERINQMAGYKAVAQLRLVQTPICGRSKTGPVSPPPVSPSPKQAEPNRLGGALARIAAGIKARQA